MNVLLRQACVDRKNLTRNSLRRQHLLAFFREVWDNVHKLPPSVSQTVGQNALELFGGVARERVAHLDGGWQTGGAAREQLVKVFTGVSVSGHEQGHRVAFHLGDQAGGEDAGALWPLSGRASSKRVATNKGWAIMRTSCPSCFGA